MSRLGLLARLGVLSFAASSCSSPPGEPTIPLVDRPPDRPEHELFEHQKDPLNKVNVAEEHPEKVAELSKLLDAWRLWVKDRRLPTDAELTQGVSGEELERLRSLGYVQ